MPPLRSRTPSAVAAVLRLRCVSCGTTLARRDDSRCAACDGVRFEPAPWRPFTAVAVRVRRVA